MQDLIAMLEKAEKGSRELDHEIAAAVGHMKQVKDDVIYDPPYPNGQPRCQPMRYTTSLDAALTLVPEGWQWQIRQDPSCYRAGIVGGKIPNMTIKRGESKTPALAMTIAALRARGDGMGETRT